MIVDVESIYERFCARTLPYEEWTHVAHLAVCWRDLHARSPQESLRFLRHAIRSYNDAVGTVNSDSSGYHETITAYFVGAVASMEANTFRDLAASALADRDSPLRYWSRDRLFSAEARSGWREPDIAPLGFSPPRASRSVKSILTD